MEGGGGGGCVEELHKMSYSPADTPTRLGAGHPGLGTGHPGFGPTFTQINTATGNNALGLAAITRLYYGRTRVIGPSFSTI